MPDVLLRIDGREYGGWQSVTVSSSLEQLAGTFDLELSDRWPGQLESIAIRKGSPCTLTYGDHLLITGYVDDVAPAFDASSHNIRVSGRDKTADLADCHHVGAKVEWKAEKLLTIAQEICAPFGIQVDAEVELEDVLPLEKYSQADSIHAFLLRLARKQSVIVASYGDGRLVFTRTGNGRIPTALIQGENIKAGRGEYSNRERFSEYHIKAQGGAGNELNFSPPLPGAENASESMELFSALAAPSGQAQDTRVGRHRPLVILAETATEQGAAEQRAKWEAAFRAGKSGRARVTVQGWEAESGTLWRINRLVQVDIPYLGLAEDRLIESATYRLDGQSGTITELGLVHPDAYLPKPLTEQKSAPLDFSGGAD